MSIRFDRENIQQIWQSRAQGKPPEDELGKALVDNQLSREEYQSLKKQFEQANPGQDFDQFLSDALDGKLDSKVNPNLLSMVQQLGRPGTAASSISLVINEARSGFGEAVSIKYDKREWVQAALDSDADKNGRIEGAELQGLQGKVDDALLQKMRAEGSVLTYDTDKVSMTFYPAPDNPTLHARYKDLKADLDLSLKDVDGISDLSRNDLSGTASGQLHFDWSGPLVKGIKQAVAEKTGGWVDLDARFVPAGDKDGYGPGYVIQARSGIIATRPIVIKADPQGQLYLESPGFGSWARLKMGEYGLENYALPQLKTMGFDIQSENKDGKIYLRPRALDLNNLPLSAQAVGKGQLHLDLANRTHFTVDANGIRARLDQVPAKGSSDITRAEAVPDRNAQGQEQADSIKGKFKVGLNYDPNAGRLDTQVVMERSEATLHLDRQELAQVGYIPDQAKKLAGDQVDATIRMQGSYRTVNGAEHEGSLQGQISLNSRQGDSNTDVFGRFKTQASQRDPNLAVNVSAVDIRQNKPGQTLRIQAESGKAAQGAKGADVSLQGVRAQSKLGPDQLAAVRKFLDAQHLLSSQFQAGLKAAGVTDAQLKILSSGSDEQIARLLSSSQLAKKIKQALVNIEADAATLKQDDKGLKISGQNVRANAELGDGDKTKATVQLATAQVDGDIPNSGAAAVKAQAATISAELESEDADGSLRSRAELKADQIGVDVQQQGTQLSVQNGKGLAQAQARSAQGAHVELGASVEGLNASQQDEGVQASAEQATATAAYTSSQGSQVKIEAQTGLIQFSQQGENQWSMTVPDLNLKQSLELQLPELKSILQQVGVMQTRELAAADAEQQANMLQRAGFTPEQISKAQALFTNPELRQAILGSDILRILDKGQTLKLEVAGTGSMAASETPGQGLRLDGNHRLDAKAELVDAEGLTLVRGNATAPELSTHVDQAGLKVVAPTFSAQAEGLDQQGKRFGEVNLQTQDVSLQAGEGTQISTGASTASLDYTSDGTRIQAEAKANAFHFQNTAPNQWALSVPDLESKARFELQLGELKELVAKLGAETISKIAKEPNQANIQAGLEKAGLTSEQAKKASSLIWRPELQSLLASSDFIAALQEGNVLKLEIAGKGNLSASETPTQSPELISSAKVDMQGTLSSNDGKTLISSQLQSEHTDVRVAQGELTIQSPDVEIQAAAHRLDGTQFASLNARAEALKATLGPTGSAVSTGPAKVDASIKTTLDAKKIEEIQKLLTDFRDDLVARLQKLGLNREQFEQIIKAFGKEQLEALFKSFKPDSIANLSQDLGLSPDQIQKTLSLLSDTTFRKLVEDFFSFSQLLNDSQAQIDIKASTQGAQWSQKDGNMLASLRQLSASLDMQTQHPQGQGQLHVEATQEQLGFENRGEDSKFSWGQTEIQANGQLQETDGKRRLDGSMNAGIGAGSIREQGAQVTGDFGAIRVQASAKQQSRDGSTGEMNGQVQMNGIQTQRNEDQPDSARMQVQGVRAQFDTTVVDAQDKQSVAGQLNAAIEELKFQPNQMQALGNQFTVDATAQRDFGNQEVVGGKARLTVSSDEIASSDQAGVRISEMQFDGTGQTTQHKQGKLNTRIEFNANQGVMTDLHAKDGVTTIDTIQANGSANLQTPIVRGQMQGNVSVSGIESTPDKTSAKDFRIDQVNGTLKIKTERLRSLVAGNKDAQQILSTISERWSRRQGESNVPNLFTNKEITLEVDRGSLTGKGQDGNALTGANVTGHLRFPDLHTRLGDGDLDIALRNLDISDQPNQRTQVEVTGKLKFTPRQPEFNQSVQSLVEYHMKRTGVDMKPQVTFEDGKFRVKIDRWYLDGLLSVDFEGDQIEVKIDKAKLLHFISARGLAARFAESHFNDYLLSVDREHDTLKLSLNEFSQQLLHKDNLQIQKVETRTDNTINIEFAYTDTKAYNAQAAQRQQDTLNKTVFTNPRTQKPRTADELEDLIEDLDAVRLRRIFQEASPAQLRQILEAVGDDYDNIVNKVLDGKADYKAYPVANRAIMAAYLASDKGFLQRVDGDERQHIRNILASLAANEKARFDAALSAEERQRIQKQAQRK